MSRHRLRPALRHNALRVVGGGAATFASLVAADGAVSHWNFEESSGAVVDQIGDNDGTVVGTPDRQQPAQIGNGYNFVPNEGVDLPNNIFNSHTEGAIEAIISFDSGSGQYAIFAQGNDPNAGQLFFSVIDGRLRLHVTESGVGTDNIRGATTLTAGVFYHVAAEVDMNGYHIYVNGVEDTPYTVDGGSATNTKWFDNSTQNGSLYAIGYLNRGSPALYYDGIIDEVAVYDAPQGSAVWSEHASFFSN